MTVHEAGPERLPRAPVSPVAPVRASSPEFAWVEWLPDAILVLDPGGRVLADNGCARDLFGQAPLLGAGVEELLPGWRRRTTPARDGARPYATMARRAGGELARVDVSEKSLEGVDAGVVLLVVRPSTSTSGLELFRNLVEVDPDAKILVDETGAIALVNARTEKMFGFLRDELLGLPVAAILPGEVTGAEALGDDAGSVREITARRRDGSAFPAEVSLASVRTDSGRAVLAAIRDVSDKWFAQHRFQQLVEHAPDAKVIVDEDGTIALVNAQTEHVFGYDRTQVVGRPVELLLPDAVGSYLRELREDPDRAAGRHTIVSGDADWVGRRADGTDFPVEVSLSLLQTEDGLLVSAAVRDLTERRMAERRFRDLLESAPDGKVIADEDGLIVLVNQRTEELFGWTREEMIGSPIEMLLPFELRERHRAHRAGFRHAERPLQMGAGNDLRALRKDGSYFPVEITLAPLQTEDGVLVSAAVRDISERVALQAESERMKSEFFATLSHELRTPLTSIIGYGEMLEDMDDDSMSPVARRFLEVISRSAARELRLVDDLLTLVAIEDSSFDVNPTRSSLVAVVRQAVAEAAPAAHEAGQEIRLIGLDDELAEGLFVELDEQRLTMALAHLTQNVVKHCPRGTRLDVSVHATEDSVVLELSDDGPGIGDGELSHVFERLFRGADAVRDERQGAGLGLPIAKAIVEGHGGRLVGESAPGRGTTFRVILPKQRSTSPRQLSGVDA
ncbi:PAS domain S-box protein [Nocardioidaceae bacterium]|nr:PAS domain S-box protein [Nocardioidaceae bacterium]